MQNPLNRWMTTLVLLVLFAIAAVAGTRRVAQVQSTATNVLVTNTTTQPVPVKEVGSWTTVIAGTPNAHVTNVVITEAMADKYPFQQPFGLHCADQVSFAMTSFTVPTGKRLVIDSVDDFSYADAAGNYSTHLTVGIIAQSSFVAMAHLQLTPWQDAPDRAALSQPIHLEAEPGQQVEMEVSRINMQGAVSDSVTLQGHYVPFP